MTTASYSDRSTVAEPDRATARRALVPVAIGSGVVSAFFCLMRANSMGEALSMAALTLVATALVFGLVVRRGLDHEAAPMRALVMSVIGLLLAVPAFWSGLPLVLGAAGALLGFAGKRASTRSGLCIAALVVGLLAVIGYLGLYVTDWITDPGASWWS